MQKKKIKLIKINLNKLNELNLDIVIRKLYDNGCRNLLVEGGKDLSISFLKKRLFNQFYLFKSPNKIIKEGNFKEFNPLKYLKKTYKYKNKINTYLENNNIYLYKN